MKYGATPARPCQRTTTCSKRYTPIILGDLVALQVVAMPGFDGVDLLEGIAGIEVKNTYVKNKSHRRTVIASDAPGFMVRKRKFPEPIVPSFTLNLAGGSI